MPSAWLVSVDGALEPQMWPVVPLHSPHPVRAGFWDPRGTPETGGAYHFGIDITVDDAHPESDVPKGTTHRVYAMAPGTMHIYNDQVSTRCGSVHETIGNFEYWHIHPAMAPGAPVQRGDLIGYTCAGYWHLHLSEFHNAPDGRNAFMDLLRPHGPLGPILDAAAPKVSELTFFAPAPSHWTTQGDGLMQIPQSGKRLPVRHLTGLVDVRAAIFDRPGFEGFASEFDFAGSMQGRHPYRAHLTIQDVTSKRKVISRDIWRTDSLRGPRVLDHYAPGTHRFAPTADCTSAALPKLMGSPNLCKGVFWFHMASWLGNSDSPYWNTHLVANGSYLVNVAAWDEQGNADQRSQIVRVAN